MRNKDWQISNANIVLPGGTKKGGVFLTGGRIRQILDLGKEKPDILNLNLHGLYLFPGLINGHDSLLGTYYPFKSKSAPYSTWLGWDNELKSSPLFRERMLLDAEELYLLGAYKNILGGATFVVDHIPHFVRNGAATELPIHLLPDFGISHSICSYSLGWGEGILAEYNYAREKNLPYITHIAEGFDRESRESLNELYERGCLGENTVLVHGISLSLTDLDRIAKARASIVWCPSSNLQLYNATLPIREAIERGINICLGTDSAMTGSSNLIEEMRSAAAHYEKQYEEILLPKKLYEMVSSAPVKAFKLHDRGEISEGAAGDMLVIKKGAGSDPHAALLETHPEGIYLLVRDGIPIFGDADVEPIFREIEVPFETITVNGNKKIIYKGIKELLDSIATSIGYHEQFAFLPIH